MGYRGGTGEEGSKNLPAPTPDGAGPTGLRAGGMHAGREIRIII